MPYTGEGSTFFGDQDVFQEDLNNIEYTKTKMIRDTTRRTMEQPGVCTSSKSSNILKVTKSGTTTFTINPGTAIDGYGRLIEVPVNTAASGSIVTDPYYHPAWPDREDISHGKTPTTQTVYYVHLKYATQTGINEVDDSGISYPTRKYNSFEVVINQSASGSGDSVVLAGLTIDGGTYNISKVVDLRTFYSALIPTDVSIVGHQRDFHETGIGGDSFPVYTGTSALQAAHQGNLGITINDLAGDKQVVFNDIEDFVNINGTYLTSGLLVDNITWKAADLQGYYVVYLAKDKIVRRTSVNNFTAASSIDVLPLFQLYWDGNTELSIISDLRKWHVADTWIGNSQLASGSLTLNSGSMARTPNTNLNFIDNRASLRYDHNAEVFYLSKDLRITSANLAINNGAGAHTISRLFFNDGGKYFYWDPADQMFFASDSFVAQGDLSAQDNVNVGRNKDNTITTNLNFNLNSPFNIKIMWDGTNQRFDINQEIYAQSNIKIAGDIYVNSGGPDGNSYIFFREGGADNGEHLRWDNSANHFYLTDDVWINGTLHASEHCQAAGAIYTKYSSDPLSTNAVVYFGGTGVDSRTLSWSHTFNRFEFDRGLQIAGDLKASGDLYCNQVGGGEGYLFFNGTAWATDPGLKWSPPSGKFEFNRGLQVTSSQGIYTTGNLVADDNVRLNYHGDYSLEDSRITFGGSIWDGSEPELQWRASNTRFHFNRDVRVDGDLTVDGSLVIPPLNPIPSPAIPVGALYFNVSLSRLYIKTAQPNVWSYFNRDGTSL